MYRNVTTLCSLVLLLFFTSNVEIQAQSNKAFFVEFLGNGLIFSANYDMRFKSEPTGLGARVGIGYIGGSDASVVTVPLLVNYLLGKEGKYFEVGAGITYVAGQIDLDTFADDQDSDSTIIGTMSFMYRKQPVDGGFMWKIGFTPVIASGAFVPWWPGVSIGYSW